MRVVGLRGATTLDHDSREEVVARTAELVQELLRRNDLVSNDLISMLLTATDDVGSEFPAAAVRACGITDVPVICARELTVTGGNAMPLCIRILAHAYSAKPRHQLRHVYLRDARQLRSDLPE